jgi:DNA sulfur modification protein DndB
MLDSLLKPYLNKYKSQRCYPGLIFKQGRRTMLQIKVSATEIANLLQAKPLTANNPDSGKDRPEIKGHVEEIKDYIIERASNNEPLLLATLTWNQNA